MTFRATWNLKIPLSIQDTSIDKLCRSEVCLLSFVQSWCVWWNKHSVFIHRYTYIHTYYVYIHSIYKHCVYIHSIYIHCVYTFLEKNSFWIEWKMIVVTAFPSILWKELKIYFWFFCDGNLFSICAKLDAMALNYFQFLSKLKGKISPRSFHIKNVLNKFFKLYKVFVPFVLCKNVLIWQEKFWYQKSPRNLRRKFQYHPFINIKILKLSRFICN